MIGAISGVGAIYNINGITPYSRTRTQPGQVGRADQAQRSQAAQPQGAVYAQRAAEPEVPVQPVRPVTPVGSQQTQPVAVALGLREGADPVEMAVRMRIRYDEALPGQEAEQAVGTEPAKSAREVAEEGKCETCEKRKYQDGSDDAGVSFKTPTQVDPDLAPAAIRGHEMEHVVREQAKAQREDRKVVSQSVTYHTNICPECGKVYMSGGTTRTVTAANNSPQSEQQQEQDNPSGMPFSAVA